MSALARRLPLLLVLSALGLPGCTATGPAQHPAPAHGEQAEGGEERPALPAWLELTDEQEKRILALRERVKRAGEPVVDSGEGMLKAMTGAARRCREDTTLLDMRAARVVAAGERARGPVLDAIDELHAILTPKQRARLVEHLLDRERASTDESRSRSSDERSRSLGSELDLSWGQIGAILIRLRKLQGIYEERAEPWLERYRSAVRAFARSEFAIREHEITEVPVVKLATDFATDAFRLLIPLLEPEQCRALAREIDARLEARRESR